MIKPLNSSTSNEGLDPVIIVISILAAAVILVLPVVVYIVRRGHKKNSGVESFATKGSGLGFNDATEEGSINSNGFNNGTEGRGSGAEAGQLSNDKQIV